MTRKEAERQTHQQNTLVSLGFTTDQAEALRRISMTLHRWYELECGTDSSMIERDETTDKPSMAYYDGSKKRSYPIPDREKGAIRRLTAIMATVPHLSHYLQTDPRGAALYILRPGDVPEGENADSYYSRGVAVYK